MIRHPAFPVDAWCVRETDLDLDMLAETESLFALSNGHLGWRGNLDEGEPNGLPGSYLNGCHERRQIPYPEFGYGLPEYGQTVINVTNGKLIRLLVDDEPFDVRYGHLRSHERVLDFRAGTLARVAEWISPAGRAVRVRSTRLVSLTNRAVAAICYEVEPLDAPADFVVQSELVANEQLPEDGSASADPRGGTVLQAVLHGETHAARDGSALLVHRTLLSNVRVAAAMAHVVDGPLGTGQETDSSADSARLTVSATVSPGQPLKLVKLVGYAWSSVSSLSAPRDQVEAALAAAAQTGWSGLLEQQRAFLADFWHRADVELDGDPELQQAIRFGLFHVLQAGARAEAQAIPAKGLTGPGYDGHAFWDTEMFVLPMLTFTYPDAVADALRWRHSTLAKARVRAGQLGLRGAAFPWRTIDGAECSGYWPAGTAAFHVNADIADAVIRYVDVTGDARFEASPGLELLVETARLWQSLGHHTSSGEFRIDGVTGPDEYSALADNNVYTNLMAQHNLRAAADAAQRHPTEASALDVSSGELDAWRRAADAMAIPYDDELGIHPQAEGFTAHEAWDFAGTTEAQYPLLQHFPYFDLYRKQVVKQADLVLAMQQRPDAFSSEQKARNFAYYERLTVRDSSLSAATQSVIAAEVGQLELAYDYLAESALIDLDDTELNVADGLHLAALAGAWTAVVAGLGGLRNRYGKLTFAPRLPAPITRLAFTISFRGQPLRTEITGTAATYELEVGAPAIIRHHGREFTLTAGMPLTVDIPPIARPERLSQPHGREPARHSGRPAASRDGALTVLVVQDDLAGEPAIRQVG
ncbi:MAG TPA: glycosyl hydrolase family 65 protein [Streptosporangiaceae bacterium]|nr:glycosyl hydrolase family 65 protein [Streptosporangiaceae bacterium]